MTPEEFTLATAGKLCSDDSSASITDKEKCSDAFQAVKQLYPDASDGIWFEHSWKGRPKGCFFHLPNKNLHWNPHETGSRNPQDQQVCTVKSKEEGKNKVKPTVIS